VHQEARPKGCELPDGTYPSIDAVVQRLRGLAVRTRSEPPAGPQPEVSVVAASNCAGSAKHRQSITKQPPGTEGITSD